MRARATTLALLVVAAPAFSIAAAATSPRSSGSGAEPGSADCEPSPARPMGWRGDWTGRFPGATPPMTWSRRVKGFDTIRYQARKPRAGKPDADAKQLEFWTIKDWLVAGPFDVADPAKDIDRDLLNGEATVQPNEGDRAGPVRWKFVRVGMDQLINHDNNQGQGGHMAVEFCDVFGEGSFDEKGKFVLKGDFENKTAYGHTYVYVPGGGAAMLGVRYAGAACRAWLNGKPVAIDQNRNWPKDTKIELERGWNRLLIEVSTAQGAVNRNGIISAWRFAAYLQPAGPVEYRTKNIAWMTRVTGRSMSAPVIAGDRVFVGSGITDLMCISRTNGKVLWIRSNTAYDALTPEERAPFKAAMGPLMEQLDAMNRRVTDAINGYVSPRGMDTARQGEMDRRLKEKKELERTIEKKLIIANGQRPDGHKNRFRDKAIEKDPAAAGKKRFLALSGNEVSSSNPTPVTDGKHVWWLCGGGMKGPGAYVISCFTPEGRRVWSRYDNLGASEHGNHSSPVLIDGTLICALHKTVLGIDAATGTTAWQVSTPKAWQKAEVCGASPVPVRINGEACVYAQNGLYRVADGEQLGETSGWTFGDATPVIENGVIYRNNEWGGWVGGASFAAVQLPAKLPPRQMKKVVHGTNRLGDIPYWLGLGPVPVTGNSADVLDKAFLGDESALSPEVGDSVRVNGKVLEWKAVSIDGGRHVDGGRNFGNKSNVAIYLVAYVKSARAVRNATLSWGSDDSGTVYLNGRQVGRYVGGRGCSPDQEKASSCSLRAGVNTIVMKVVNGQGGYGGTLRLLGADGRPLESLPVVASAAGAAGSWKPVTAPQKKGFDEVFKLKRSEWSVPLRNGGYMIASPLLVGDLCYNVESSAGLAILDVKKRKGVYARWLDSYNRYTRYVYGVCVSPTLAGRYVYLIDDAGCAMILEAGEREYREVGRNIIENIHLSSESGQPCKQEAFYSNPVFRGKQMFLKGEEYVYCIGVP